MGNDDNHSLNDYFNAFTKFNDYVKSLHSESNKSNNIDKAKEGYFVNLYYYNDLINKVNECFAKNQIQYGSNAAFGQVNFDKLKTESLKEVSEKINKDYSFIIINEDLFKVICDQEKQSIHKITYKITTEDKLIIQENELQKQFKNNKNNTISKATILGNEGNNTIINSNPIPQNNYENKIYESIKIYIDNEKDILGKLNSNLQNMYQGFLVDNEWVEEWKTYSNYNNFIKLFQTNNINEIEIKNKIRQEVQNKNLNFNNLKYIDKYILKDVTQLKSPITANKKYFLLNGKFINLFVNNEKENANPNNFFLSYQKVDIKINNIPFLSFQTNSNIIFNKPVNNSNITSIPAQTNPNIIQTNNIYQSEFLKHLIRLPIFNKEIKASSYSQQKILKKAYIINNEIITILKQKYDLKKVVNKDLNNFLININYSNIDQYYPEICKILHEKNIEYINSIKQLETTGAIQFSEREKKLDYKYLYNNQPNFLFIDNIEIIDENFAKFLNQKFNNSIKMLQTYYVAIEEKILLIICVNQSFIYEIVSFNQNGGDYLFDYLLEIKN